MHLTNSLTIYEPHIQDQGLHPSLTHINTIHQPPPMVPAPMATSLLLPLTTALTSSLTLTILTIRSLIRPLSPHIHRVIRALCKPILPLPVMRDHSAEHRARIVLCNTADHHAVRTRRLAVVGRAIALDGEFEVGFLCVAEGEVLVVVVGVWVLCPLGSASVYSDWRLVNSHLSRPVVCQ